jgi:DNA-binding IscR family transcriptional regulator
MFSKTCEYAIRAMIFIAQKSRDGYKTGIREIAKELIPRNILSPRFCRISAGGDWYNP